MGVLGIIQLILTVAPAGLRVTQEVISLFEALEAAFKAGSVPQEHQTKVVTALAPHLSK